MVKGERVIDIHRTYLGVWCTVCQIPFTGYSQVSSAPLPTRFGGGAPLDSERIICSFGWCCEPSGFDHNLRADKCALMIHCADPLLHIPHSTLTHLLSQRGFVN